VSSGFGTDCRNCHSGMRFSPADFPAHAACFRINNGPHANMTCENCHKPPPTGVANGACQTNSAACSSCHAHSCARMDAEHADKNVAGYQCKDRKCYECHKGA
jgi:nitrate/TMAO reductase-like tetraheme cytochrome c subunit